jgi:hypothetical protein
VIGRRHSHRGLALAAVAFGGLACHHRRPAPPAGPAAPTAVKPTRPPIPQRAAAPALAPAETLVYERGVAKKMTIAAAQAAGLLDVDLSDAWAPYILQDGDPPQPNDYRQTFVGLANDRLDADGDPARAGNHNYLEAFGIPPTLSALASRAE